jgi:hypothetical protein
MTPDNNNLDQISRLLKLAVPIVFLVCVLVTVQAYRTSQDTGILDVTASDSNALISITQNGKGVETAGTGKAKVRLQPGTYLVGGFVGGKQGSEVVQITKRHTTQTSLKVNDLAKVPSADSIDFSNINRFLDAGLTSTQVTALKQAFFAFKQTSHTVAINADSVQPAPHNPQSDDPFILNFKVSVDSTPYSGQVIYSDLDNIRLVLTDPSTNTSVFDSASANAE